MLGVGPFSVWPYNYQMPTQKDITQWALLGIELEIARLTALHNALRSPVEAPSQQPGPQTRRTHKRSAAARKNMREAQLKRWAEIKRKAKGATAK